MGCGVPEKERPLAMGLLRKCKGFWEEHLLGHWGGTFWTGCLHFRMI